MAEEKGKLGAHQAHQQSQTQIKLHVFVSATACRSALQIIFPVLSFEEQDQESTAC